MSAVGEDESADTETRPDAALRRGRAGVAATCRGNGLRRVRAAVSAILADVCLFLANNTN